MSHETVLIVGIGNELLGDEGLGVHVARALLAARSSLPPHVDVIEAGTALLDVLPEMARYSCVILVDAVQTGNEPGTVYRTEAVADFAGQFTLPPVSLHQWGVLETLWAARALGLEPEQLILVGAEPESLAPSTQLSPKLQQAAEKILSLLVEETRPCV